MTAAAAAAKSWLLSLCHIVLAFTVGVSSLAATKFRFKLDQLYEVSIGLDNLRGIPAAFGSFNNKVQHTDIFIITPNQHTIQLWTWENRNKEFNHLTTADITLNDITVTNVITGDFNMDGSLDILVQGLAKDSKEVKQLLYLGDGSKGFSLKETLDSSADALPFAFDYNGDSNVDLLGASWKDKDNSSTSSIWVWKNNAMSSKGNSSVFSLQPFESPSIASKTKTMCKLAAPHSSAFVDLDGDCLADLFIVCEGGEEYQIWTNSPDGFKYSQTGQLPSNAGPVSFADINGDGSLDMVIPILGKSQIYVVYNTQRPLCVGIRKTEGCRKFKRICEADSSFSFNLAQAQVLDISKFWPDEQLLDSIEDFKGNGRPAIKLADFSLDGFPDMAFVTKEKNKSKTHVRLLRSAKCRNCTTIVDTKNGAKIDQRWFEPQTKGVDVLEKLGKPQDIAFFDIDESGTVDLLVYYLDSKNEKRIAAIYNNFFTDAFFIKALVCPANNGNGFRSYAGYLPGASYKYLLVSDSGKKHVAQSLQVPQTAYRALFTPYSIIGIGRTNNYIEDFSVGSTSQLGRHQRSFEGLIPNSQVLIFPHNNTNSWRLELYMNKSQSTPYILATLLSSMGILAITVFTLGRLERKADEREKQRALHSINFDAL